MVKSTLDKSRTNSILAFCDNSSSIQGYHVHHLVYKNHYNTNSALTYKKYTVNPTLTAETHNFPTGIAPFQGANTGVGGRIRDTLAIGCGGDIIASCTGYCVGNLMIPDFIQSWEQNIFDYNSLKKQPLDILINASNGASDYGNKVGEPIISGFVRTFGDFVNEEDY